MDFQSPGPRSGRRTEFRSIVSRVIVMLILAGLLVGGITFFRELSRMAAPTPRPTPADESGGNWVRVAELPSGSESGTETGPVELPAEISTGTETARPPEEVMRDVMVGLADVKDGAALEPEPLYWLIGQADKGFGTTDLITERMPETSVAELEARPADFRGKPVKLTGVVARFKSEDRLPANPSGIEAVSEGDLDIGPQRVWFVIPRTGVDIRSGDRVRLIGLFFKIYRYQDAEGRRGLGPAVVITNISLLSRPVESSGPVRIETMLAVLGALLAVYVAMLFYMRRRQQAHYDKMAAWRRRREP